MKEILLGVVVSAVLSACGGGASCIDGIYPHLAMSNDEGDWVRVRALADAKGANARFRYGPKRPAKLPAYDGFVEVYDDYSKKTYRFPNVNGDKTVICREVATERDLLYAGGVFYEVPADNAGGFAALRPIALADEPVHTITVDRGLVAINRAHDLHPLTPGTAAVFPIKR